MIHYSLRCGSGHEFDGWFKDSTSFDAQAAGGLLDCPICADRKVERALMAPRVRSSKRRAAAPVIEHEEKAVAVPAPGPPGAGGAPSVPDQIRAVLQRARAEIEKNCEYVGPRFAEAAREIHEGAVPPKAIYGEATPEEAASLAEDGIEVARIPWVPRADS
jgi:hypothetical protein